MRELLVVFQDVEDLRRDNAKRHDLHGMLVVALLAVLVGGRTCVDMEDFGREREEWLRRFPTESHPWLSAGEREHILRGRQVTHDDVDTSPDAFAPGWWEMFRYRQSWAVIGSRFFIDSIWFGVALWLPLYLAEQFGFNVKDIAWFAWTPYVGAALGAILGGVLAQILIARGTSVNRARKSAIALGGVLMVVALLGRVDTTAGHRR